MTIVRNPYRSTTHTVLPSLRQTEYSLGDLVASLTEFIAALRAQAQKEANSPEPGEAAKTAVKDAETLLDATESLTKVLDEDRSFDLLVAFHAVSRLSRHVPTFADELQRMMAKRAKNARDTRSLQAKERKRDQRQCCFDLWTQQPPSLNWSARDTANFLDSENKTKKRGSQLEKDVGIWKRAWEGGSHS